MFLILVTLIILLVPILSINCPEKCTCSGTTVFCARKGLTEVPSSIPNTTTFLDVNFNRLTSIRTGAFDALFPLKLLWLSNNRIKTIGTSTFHSLVNLEIIWLSNNQIKTITVGTFDSLVNLKSLWLNNNQIKTIYVGTFDSLLNLNSLSLGRNKLTNISNDVFRSLHNLTQLWLNYNQITNIGSSTFKGLSNMELLDLTGNPIQCHCSLVSFVNNTKVKHSTKGKCREKNKDLSDLTIADLSCAKGTRKSSLVIESNDDNHEGTISTILRRNRTEFTTISTIPTTPTKHGKPLSIIIGLTIAMAVIYVTLAIYCGNKCLNRKRKQRRKREKQNILLLELPIMPESEEDAEQEAGVVTSITGMSADFNNHENESSEERVNMHIADVQINLSPCTSGNMCSHTTMYDGLNLSELFEIRPSAS